MRSYKYKPIQSISKWNHRIMMVGVATICIISVGIGSYLLYHLFIYLFLFQFSRETEKVVLLMK